VRCHHDQADDTPLSVPLRCSLVALSPRQTGAPVRNRDTNSLLRWEARAFAHCHVARQWRCDPSLPGNSDAASSSQPLSLNGPFPGAVRLPGAGRNPTHHAPATLDRTYFQVAVSCVPVIHRSQVIPALLSFSRHYFQVAVSRCVVTRLSQVMSSLLQAVLRSLLPGGGVALRRCLAVPGHLGSPSVVTISTSRCHACQSPTDPRSSQCSFRQSSLLPGRGVVRASRPQVPGHFVTPLVHRSSSPDLGVGVGLVPGHPSAPFSSAERSSRAVSGVRASPPATHIVA
jgi:hypothetical protein